MTDAVSAFVSLLRRPMPEEDLLRDHRDNRRSRRPRKHHILGRKILGS